MTTIDICYTMCRGEGSPFFFILHYIVPLIIGFTLGWIVNYVRLNTKGFRRNKY